MYYASLLGLVRALQELLSPKQQENVVTYTLSQTATSQGADVNSKGGYYGYSLEAASSKGHEKIVDMLVKKVLIFMAKVYILAMHYRRQHIEAMRI